MSLFNQWFPNVVHMDPEFINATWQTIYMTSVTAIVAGILGILIGISLVITGLNVICQKNQIY